MSAFRTLVVASAVTLAAGAAARADDLPAPRDGSGRPVPVTAIARVGPGGIHGVVLDDAGAPLHGAMVSALGATAAFAVTDSYGRFALAPLPPGAYLVRAHLGGYVPSRGRMIEVRPEAKAVSSILLRKAGAGIGTSGETSQPPAIVAAGFGSPSADAPQAADAPEGETGHDHGETAWRLRHLKRSVLKEATEQAEYIAAKEAPGAGLPDPISMIGRAMESSARLASNIFGEIPFSGELNLLTTGAFDNPLRLFSSDGLSRSVAFLSIGAAAGTHGDWAVRGAMTQGDVASWILAGSYTTRTAARHAYDVGMSYSMQRYDGGNPAALAAVTDGSRNAGAVYAFDRWRVSRSLTFGYGARYSRYDYLEGAGFISPRLTATVAPVDHVRIQALVSRHVLAPGAEEFVPPISPALWLPPERTFAPVVPQAAFMPERAQHYEVGVERDLTDRAIIGFRTFYQRVDDQLVTIFGIQMPSHDASDLGHYYVGTGGDFEARGWGVSLTHTVADRVRTSVDYSLARAEWLPSSDAVYIAAFAPSAVRNDRERLHDLTTSVETEIPQTATRVFMLYRINTAFARHDKTAERPGAEGRFDVQVNQSLPFLNFTSAEWEMLVAVRNLFRETLADASLYDELLAVKPPKRLIGGIVVRF